MNANLASRFRWFFFSLLIGILAGVASTIFLVSLKWATETREHWPLIILGLPLAGLLIGWVYHKYGVEAARGQNLILDEIHDPKKTVPLRMAPLILVSTLLTHLFGGSAGREGTVVQMGASLADQLSRYFKIENHDRKILLAAGAGAGFGAALGAPWAGWIFGMEVIQIGRLRVFAWFQCFVSSFVAYYTTVFLQAPHSVFPLVPVFEISFSNIMWVAVAGICFGGAAKVFTMLAHGIENLSARVVRVPYLRPFVGGVLLVILYYIEGSFRYDGLGIDVIQQALIAPASFLDPAYKTFFTGLTVGSGFKGGEFIPLVFIGASLGSALGLILPVSFQLLASTGFAAVFAGASNTPIACSIMAMEVFGPKIGVYAFLACFMSYFFSGHHGLYKSQRILQKKHRLVANLFRIPRK